MTTVSSNPQAVMFSDPAVLPVNALLTMQHYLGPSDRGRAYRDEFGVLVFVAPTSRRLPQARWLELARWCITGGKGAGTQQWAAARHWLLAEYPDVSTIVSYSDPSVGHDGALYRASNWLWAPTWQRLRPPPSGNGDWGSGRQSVKDRWVDPLRPDDERESLLRIDDESVDRRMPWASYREPVWRRGRRRGGGGDFKQFALCYGARGDSCMSRSDQRAAVAHPYRLG